MFAALHKESVNVNTRGEGEKGNTRGDGGKGKDRQQRPRSEDFQVMFKCVVARDLIVAGREGVVK